MKTPLHPAPRAAAFPLRRALLALCVVATFSCSGDGALGQKEAKSMHLAGSPSEASEAGFLGMAPVSLYERLEQLRTLAETPDQRGLFLHVDAFHGGYAAQRELARALARVRKAGKPVHCHFEGTDNAGYALLASSCDRITMPPSGLLDVAGVRAQAFFAGELLQSIGVNAELMQVGRFKGAAEALTSSTMPDTTREALTRISSQLQASLVTTLAKGRGLSEARINDAVAAAPLSAHSALSFGLVDAVEYADEAHEHLRKAAQVKRLTPMDAQHEGPDIGGLLRSLSGEPQETPDAPYVALLPMTGTISMGSGPSDSASAQTFVHAMRRMRDDEKAAAIVLRIDSPGGSALASDLMWHAVYEARKVKPVYVSIGNMAASGGYYIASAAQHIMAEETSLVGSIGVVGGKIAIAGLAEKLGVQIETLRAADNAGWSDPTTPLTDSQRAALKKLLESTYDLFIHRVATGRGVSAASLQPMAEGRLHMAQAAVEGGLVDGLGGLFDTLELAREAAKLPRSSRVFVWRPGPADLAHLLGDTVHAPPTGLQRLQGVLTGAVPFPLVDVFAGGEKVAASLPFGLRLD